VAGSEVAAGGGAEVEAAGSDAAGAGVWARAAPAIIRAAEPASRRSFIR
jgi:hypothetical protein